MISPAKKLQCHKAGQTLTCCSNVACSHLHSDVIRLVTITMSAQSASAIPGGCGW